MNEVSSGSARHPEGSVDAGFNFGHKIGDGTFFDVILLVVFNPEIPCGRTCWLGQNIHDYGVNNHIFIYLEQSKTI